MNIRKLLLLLAFTFFMASCSRDPKVQAQRYVENGNKFFEKSKFKEASIMYRRALQKDLRFGEAYYRLALADIKLASYGDAVRSLRRAVELQPGQYGCRGEAVRHSIWSPSRRTGITATN